MIVAVGIAAGRVSAATLLVPAYFDASTYPDAWASLATAAKSANLVAIVNPNSGPGTAADPAYTSAINSVRTAGGKVIGYVHTKTSTNALRTLSAVEAEVDEYQAYYGTLDGIFVDEMSNSTKTSTVNFYKNLYNYIKGKNANALVVGNPGTDVPQQYTAAADVLVNYESPAADYASYTPSAWTQTVSASHFAQMVYGVSADALNSTLAKIASQNAEYVYVTDDVLPNPYDTLPSYWSAEVAAVVPEPASLGAAGVMLVVMARRTRRRVDRVGAAKECK